MSNQFNKTTTLNYSDYAVITGFSGVFGIVSHVIGHVAEAPIIYAISKLPYPVNLLAVPIAKISHEIVEGIFNAITPIDIIHNGIGNKTFMVRENLNTIFDPLFKHPGQTITATLSSWMAETFAIKVFKLHECGHHHHHHHHHNDHIIKGLASISGAFIGTYMYEPACDYISGAFIGTYMHEPVDESKLNDEL
jgi:hypothetical protein